MARAGAASLAPLVRCLVLVFGVTAARGAYVISAAETDTCSQQGMDCSLSSSNCLDPGWVNTYEYTPSGPDRLDLRISTRRDLEGKLLPVINASWTLKDDGSIRFLDASELHVVTASTNQNLCVRYSFSNRLAMRSPSRDQWTLRSDVLVVDPGELYSVWVENIPKANLDHSSDRISREVSVPGCSDPEMKLTQPCIDSGSLWSPEIRLSQSGKSISVEFSPDPLSERYSVFCRCDVGSSHREIQSVNSSRLRLSFPLELRACCLFHIEIKPYFSRCGNDCRRHRSKSLDLCPKQPSAPPADPWSPLPVALGVSSVLLLSVALGVCAIIICRRKVGKAEAPPGQSAQLLGHRLKEHPTLLLIYSRDHPLFLDVVLKLAAFLQAHCGILVLLDLLDSSAVSQVGLVRWLELQRNKLRPNDKILVLCSRGVQSKWKAMCGQGNVPHQPDDLIGPFLSLFLSDMHQPGAMGRYIAAYFEQISSAHDVPSFFDIAVKYKLMKHFEELYFRVLDMEKYEPRQVNHIEGIGPDEFFRCQSGRQLQNAVDKFRALQIQNPEWFEKGETEDVDEPSLLIEYTPQQLPPIFECIPIVRQGPQIYTNDVLANEKVNNFYVIAPASNNNASISANEPILKAATNSPNESILELQPDLCWNLEILQSDVIPAIAAGDEKVAAGVSVGQKGERVAGLACLKPEPAEVLEERKGDASGSDQGYSSRTEPDSDDLMALQQLQQELMSNVFHCDAQ